MGKLYLSLGVLRAKLCIRYAGLLRPEEEGYLHHLVRRRFPTQPPLRWFNSGYNNGYGGYNNGFGGYNNTLFRDVGLRSMVEEKGR